MQQSVGNRAVQRSVGDLVGALTDTRRGLVGAVLSLPAWLGDAAASGPMPATVRMLVRRGNEDEDSLTNTCFFLSHPEVPWGTKLRPDEVPDHRPLVGEWIRIRDEVVRPELSRIRAARGAPVPETGPTPAPPPPRAVEQPPSAPAPPASGRTTGSRQFLDQHRALLEQLPTTGDDELLFLLDHVLAKGSATVIEYHAYTTHDRSLCR
jgi:hypothetical protein